MCSACISTRATTTSPCALCMYGTVHVQSRGLQAVIFITNPTATFPQKSIYVYMYLYFIGGSSSGGKTVPREGCWFFSRAPPFLATCPRVSVVTARGRHRRRSVNGEHVRRDVNVIYSPCMYLYITFYITFPVRFHP